jgi:Reverse transcriptase (RNA-dependent DNA polymerase)
LSNKIRWNKWASYVIKGYKQIAWTLMNFIHHVPVLVMALYFSSTERQWTTELIDVKATFLNAEVDQDIFIEIPEGLHEFMTKTEKSGISSLVKKLKHAQYGLVQSPCLWMITFSNILKSIRMQQFRTLSPHLPFSGDPNAIIIVYCDDCIITGINNTVKSLKKEISKHVNITQ